MLRISSAYLRAAGSAVHAHLAGGDGDPLVAGGVEPGQPEGVLAVDVDVLAVREPPTSFVVTGAVGVRDVPIAVNSRELHVVLVLKCIASVTLETADLQYVASVGAANVEVFILSIPEAAVDVSHVDAHGGAVVSGQQVHRFQSEPVFRGRITETVDVFCKLPVEFDASVVATLYESAAVGAPGVEGCLAGMDQIHASGS